MKWIRPYGDNIAAVNTRQFRAAARMASQINMGSLFAIAVGGAVGSVARYLVHISPIARVFENFPFATFAINVIGSLFAGFLFIFLADRSGVSEPMRLGLLVGFLGAFTTFATFELELYGLIRDGQMLSAFLYLLLSVALGFLGVMGGVWIAQRFV